MSTLVVDRARVWVREVSLLGRAAESACCPVEAVQVSSLAILPVRSSYLQQPGQGISLHRSTACWGPRRGEEREVGDINKKTVAR